MLRHGATTQPACYIGRSDPPLTEPGLVQMRTASAGGSWSRIVSSPRRRCAAFARMLAAARGLPLSFDARFAELDFGDWDGVPVATLHARTPGALAAFWRDPLGHPPPNGETLAALQTRVLAALHELAGGGTALIVTHGGPLRIAIAARDGLPLGALMTIDVPHAARFAFAIERDGAALRVRDAARASA